MSRLDGVGMLRCELCGSQVDELIQPVELDWADLDRRMRASDPVRCRQCPANLDAGTHILFTSMTGKTTLVQVRE